MPEHTSPALVITDGGLGGLLACWTEGVRARGLANAEGPAPVGWVPAGGLQPGSVAAAGRQLEFCQLADLVLWIPAVSGSGDDPLLLTNLLLAAAAEAGRRGFSRVVWPVHAGGPGGGEPDLNPIADICDRAFLVAQLAGLDLSSAPRIETPYADFSDRQMAELALDLDAPLGAAWWCEAEAAERACGRCGACARWGAAFAPRPSAIGAGGRGEPPTESGGDLRVTMGPRTRSPARG